MIESTGHMPSLADAIAMVRPGGTVLLFGIYTESEASLPFYQLYYKEPTIVSARAATPEDFTESIDLVAKGAMRLSPLVTQVLPLAELRTALGMLETDADGRMKIVLGALTRTRTVDIDDACIPLIWKHVVSRPRQRSRSRASSSPKLSRPPRLVWTVTSTLRTAFPGSSSSKAATAD